MYNVWIVSQSVHIFVVLIVVTCVRSDYLYDYSDTPHQDADVNHDLGTDSQRYITYFHIIYISIIHII